MPPKSSRKNNIGECTALNPRVCFNPITYSEQGHRWAGKYCDAHGLAIHELRRGNPCNCGHCKQARARRAKKT